MTRKQQLLKHTLVVNIICKSILTCIPSVPLDSHPLMFEDSQLIMFCTNPSNLTRHVLKGHTTTTTTTTLFSYIKYTNITAPANSKANRGRWCVDGLGYFTVVEMNNKVPYL